MDRHETRYPDIQDWEIVAIGDEYYRMLRISGYGMDVAPLTNEDLDQLLDVYHYWKILLGCNNLRLVDMERILHSLHFDVIIELFCQRKLRLRQSLSWIFEDNSY